MNILNEENRMERDGAKHFRKKRDRNRNIKVVSKENNRKLKRGEARELDKAKTKERKYKRETGTEKSREKTEGKKETKK